MIATAQLRSGGSGNVVSPLSSQQIFLFVSVPLFVASAVLTTVWCESMSAMGQMPMPGGWKMSMAWMRTPGQTWVAAAASFLGMWIVMMIAMMLPSLIPVLWGYRRAIRETSETRLDRLTAIAGTGYFFVWTLFGMAVFPLGVTLARVEMGLPAFARTAPLWVGVIVLIAGLVQFTRWKLHHLACWRAEQNCCRTFPADTCKVWRHGLRLGVHCSFCCANWTAMFLVIGIMDLRAMAVVTVAITTERLAPAGPRVARALGAVTAGAGVFLIARAARLA